MTEMILVSDAEVARISLFFPVSHGIHRVDDKRVIGGIILVIRNGLRWRDVPTSYGPHKTIYNRFILWSELGVFGRIFVELAKGGSGTDEMVIYATYLKRTELQTACSKRGLIPGISDAPKGAWPMKADRDASLLMDAFMMAVWPRGKADALLHFWTMDRNTPVHSYNAKWPTMGSPA
jgi:putative transposase